MANMEWTVVFEVEAFGTRGLDSYIECTMKAASATEAVVKGWEQVKGDIIPNAEGLEITQFRVVGVFPTPRSNVTAPRS